MFFDLFDIIVIYTEHDADTPEPEWAVSHLVIFASLALEEAR